MLNKDYKDMLFALSSAGADFLLVGAYAVSIHGRPRATGDMDIWVRPGPDNAEKVLEALKCFGAPMDMIAKEDLIKPGMVFQIGLAPDRIDLMTSISGLTFEEAWKNKLLIELDGVKIHIPSKTDLIKNKKASGRHQDLADAENIEAAE